MAGEFTLGLSPPIASTIAKVAKCFRWFVSITKRAARSSGRLEAGLRESAVMKNKGNVKAEMITMLKALPDDLTWEDLQYHIYVRQKLERAEEDIKAGRVFSQKEVEKKIRAMMKKLRQRGSHRN
jgi:predicted transcriptional regulator